MQENEMQEEVTQTNVGLTIMSMEEIDKLSEQASANNEIQKIVKFMLLSQEIKRIEDNEKELKEKKAQLEAEVLDIMATNGVDNMTAGGKTAYVHRQVWAGPKEDEKEEFIKAMKDSELSYLVTENVNSQQFSGYLREVAKEKEGKLTEEEYVKLLPENVQKHVKVTEKVSVRVRKAAKKK